MKALLTKTIRITEMHDGVSGDLTGVSGDVDLCEITDEERANGVHINDLIAKP